jgi:hypothetical protein
MKVQRRLRLIAVDGKMIAPPPPPAPPKITSIGQALAVMRLSVAIITSEPADLFRGYSSDETAEQYAAVDRMVEAFRVLDRLLTRRSKNEHPHPTRKPTREERTK